MLYWIIILYPLGIIFYISPLKINEAHPLFDCEIIAILFYKKYSVLANTPQNPCLTVAIYFAFIIFIPDFFKFRAMSKIKRQAL